MLDGERFLESVGLDARYAFELFDHLVMVLHRTVQNEFGIIHLPAPGSADR